ncbi:UvrD-helicase domain-containing protein [Candidatus Saccharibacteria bacterium]|nr:UvrD-helicase domain-containing protein [Candidatus Saccharibacteria bacterium]
MQQILESLNESQKQAVLATEGPVLMLAGAGSGKTKTLTHRIAYLIAERKIPAANILAVTFTNKAAGEMRRRVARILHFHEDNMNYLPFLGTFHSIANKILRREATHIGYPSNFLIYDTNDSQALIKHLIKQHRIDEKTITANAVGHMISSAKNELLDPNQYANFAVGRLQEAAAKIYPDYQKELRKAQAMDFDDLIMQLVKLFQTEAEVLKKYQSQFQYILVDEYQDTNNAQYTLIHLLAREHSNVCVVGDDWQSIYSWRGANYENILNFERDYPTAKIVKLEQNYRSTQTILDAAHAVISKNTARSEKELWTEAGSGAKIQLVSVRDELEEGRFIVQTIQSAIEHDPRLSRHDFAVLYRTNAQSRALEESFLRYNVPYQIVGGVRFYERKEIKDTLAYLRFVFQPNDQISLRRVINVPPRGLGERSLQTFFDYTARFELNLLEAMANATEIEGLTPKAAKAFTEFAATIKELQVKQETLPLSVLVETVLKTTGYLKYLDDGNIISADRIENLQEFIGVAKSFDNAGLEAFLTEITLISDLDGLKESQDAVTLMTLHSAKGLEFDTVFMAGMEEAIFPHSRAMFEAVELEEERRLCYVGMTRAKSKLYMIHANARMLYGRTQHNVPSRFLSDIPAELVESTSPTGTLGQLLQRQTLSDPSSGDSFDDEPFVNLPKLSPGDEVEHDAFGRGIVKSLDDSEVVVSFYRAGVKTLNLGFAPLRKV